MSRQDETFHVSCDVGGLSVLDGGAVNSFLSPIVFVSCICFTLYLHLFESYVGGSWWKQVV